MKLGKQDFKKPVQIGEARGKKKKESWKEDQAREFGKNRLEASRSRYLCEGRRGKLSEDSSNVNLSSW